MVESLRLEKSSKRRQSGRPLLTVRYLADENPKIKREITPTLESTMAKFLEALVLKAFHREQLLLDCRIIKPDDRFE